MTRRATRWEFCKKEPFYPISNERILIIDATGRTTYIVDPQPADVPPAPKDWDALGREAVDIAIHNLMGIPYGDGWKEGTWPEGSSLYSHYSKYVHNLDYIRHNPMICTGLGNILRAMIANMPAFGRLQGDKWPGGTAAIGRTLARMSGARPYRRGEHIPKGYAVFGPYLGPALHLQGHFMLSDGNGMAVEGRVPASSRNRSIVEVHDTALRITNGMAGMTHVLPPKLWIGT